MQTVVVGAGRMGYQLARHLDEEGHRVFVIDRNPARIEQLRSRLDVMAITGSGSCLKTLREAGVEGADLMIAATNSDEVNIVACLLGRELGIQRRIARVCSRELTEDLQETSLAVLGVDEFIHPEAVTVSRLRNLIMAPGTAESAEFADGRIVLRALRVESGCGLLENTLQGLHAHFTDPFLIATVLRGNDLIVPSGDFRLAEGDVVTTVMHIRHLEPFRKTYGFKRERTKRVMVFGATPLAQSLCAEIEDEIRDVILIDPDEGACRQAAGRLAKTTVLQGSSLDRSLLLDLNIDTVDVALALEEQDEENLSPALFAKCLGARRTVMLSAHPEHIEMLETLPIDAIISPMMLAVGAVLRAVRMGRVVSLFKLAGGRAEALELEAAGGAAAVGRPLREIRLPSGTVVAAVMRSRDHPSGCTCQVANGNTVIEPGDRVVLVAVADRCAEAIEAFSGDRS